MLCYVMSYHVMLCHVMLCYVMLCYFMLCYVMLCYVMSCFALGALRNRNASFKTVRVNYCCTIINYSFPGRRNGRAYENASQYPFDWDQARTM